MVNLDYIRTELTCFKIIWRLPPMESYLSGLSLRNFYNTKLSYSCCAHVLSKAQNKYPHFKLYLKNIITITPTEHHFMDAGTKEQRISYSKEVKTADWQKIWDLKAKLEEEYKKHFPSTVGMLVSYRYSEEEVTIKIRELNGLFLKNKCPDLNRSPQHK